MSVDTYLQRKNLTPYQVIEYEDVKIYVSNSLLGWAEAVHLDAKQFLVWKSFNVAAEHRHTMRCAH